MHLVHGLLLGLVLLLAACTGGSSGEGGDAPGATVAEPTPSSDSGASGDPSAVPEADPTATPEPQPATEAELIAAAVAVVEAEATADLFAADVLESSVREDGKVRLVLCGWAGDTVFDARYQSLWSVEGESGQLTAAELTTSKIDGECLNSELIDSALATVDAYGEYWTEMTADPAKIATDPRTDELLTEPFAAGAREAGVEWASDDLYFIGIPESVPVEDRLNSLLLRRYREESGEYIEFAICREMGLDYGIYRADVLVDEALPVNEVGPHSVVALRIERSIAGEAWQVTARGSLVWAECVDVVDWPRSATDWRGGPISFEELLQ